jgi:polyhydroxybutyrate depolymerase
MKTITILFFSAIVSFGYAQQTINGTIEHDAITRSYILYVPATYVPGTPAPLVLNFHGYSSNANDQMFYGDFRPIADTAGFLLVHPMGTLDGNGETHWNSGWGTGVDDIGFTQALIDSLALDYSVNLDRVYSTGMSNGGFMSYTLACSLSDRIAAIASVTGAMNLGQSTSCNAQHPTPVMEIHGTADGVILYNGSTWYVSTPNTLGFWAGYNQCDASPIVTNVPDINVIDGCTAVHSVYKNGANGVEVEHYQIVSGDHTWPGAPIAWGVTNYDINASEKIWEFFAKYDINGLIGPMGVGDITMNNVSVYPNPSTNSISIDWGELDAQQIRIVNTLGSEIKMLDVATLTSTSFTIQEWIAGTYFIEIYDQKGKRIVSRFVVE